MIRLDLSNVNLYGRSEELAVLQNAYKRVSDPKSGSSEVVLVQGYSGTGKSTLIRKLQTWIQESEDGSGYFVSGKFDQLRTTEPYSALASAFNELCDLILASTTDKEKARASFMDAVGSKGRVLLEVIPRLNQLLGDMEGGSGELVKGTMTALNQLKFVFRAFVRSVCMGTQHPVVLFLDDLQWADMASLELIKSILTDSKSTQVLFIGSFRDNEVDDSHPFAAHLREVEREKQIERIHLGNLDVDTVNQLISSITELDQSSTQPLTDVVYHKTNGNIFFVLQFLRMLQEEKLLYFSMTTYKWTWDMDKIQSQTDLSDNVVDLVAGKIQRLPVKTQAVLKLASCLWSTFDVELLQEILSKGGEKYITDDDSVLCNCVLGAGGDFAGLLDNAADEGLVDKLAGTRYKFAHDRIQQAAYSLIPEGQERILLHHWIGEQLWQMTESPRREEWMYFAAADQSNRGSTLITEEKKRVDLARLNLQAAEKAIALSAFVPAACYLKSGIDHLPCGNRWSEHSSLCLKLHNALAEMELCNGNSERTQVIVEEVIANTTSCRDKMRAVYTLCRSLMSQGKHRDALDLCYEILHKLGEQIPRRIGKGKISIECLKLWRLLRGKNDSELLVLPLMKDEQKIATMKFYDLMYDCKVALNLMHHASLIAMKMVRFTLQYGVCEVAPLAYEYFGNVLISEGEIQEGYRFGKLALKLVQRLGSKTMKTRVVAYASSFLNHWKEPLQQSLDPLIEAYNMGMVNGDITGAFRCILGYEIVYFYGGLPLSSGADDLIAFSRQMKEYKQDLIHRAQLPVLQLMLNLMGRSKDVLQLTGEVMDQKEFESLETNPTQLGVQAVASCRMQLAYYFDDLDLAAEMSKQLQNTSKNEVYSASYFVCTRTMFFGLISVALARKTKKRKHAAHAAKMIAQMERKWVKRGAVNVLHKLLLLKAEYASLKSRNIDEVKDAYDTAISTSRRIGFIQDEALANEKAGMLFLRGGNEFWASSYLSRAHELYSEWGSQAIVDRLDKQHGALLTQHPEHHSSRLRGRPRFNESLSKSHKSLRFAQTKSLKGAMEQGVGVKHT